jgi:ethanolamine utilization protein EutN
LRIARVVGQVVSTVKEDGFNGFKLLLVQDVDPRQPARAEFDAPAYLAIDLVGAGESELVAIAIGSAARVSANAERAPTDAAIVAIVDNITLGGERTYTKF